MEKKTTEKKKEELFASGHTACAGCGAAIAMREIMKALGPDSIIVNSTGCVEIFTSKYPESAWNIPYIHANFENAAPVAAGIAKALEVKGNDHTVVTCIAGDGACYSPDTKVLTDKGFVWVADIKRDDRIWSVDPTTRELELVPINKLHSYYYEGKMVRAKTRYLDFLVTPNHSIPIASRYTDKLKIIKAQELLKRYKTLLPRSFKWSGKQQAYFYIPQVEQKTHKSRYSKFKMSDWLELVGWYVTEGCCYKSRCGYLVRIYQSNKKNRKRIFQLVKRMGIHTFECNRSVDFSSKQLYSYFKSNCGAYFYEKRIPLEFLSCPPYLLKRLYDALIEGDGCRVKPGKGRTQQRETFITKSEFLKANFVELCLKLGACCHVAYDANGTARIGVEKKHVKNELYPTRIFSGGKPQVFEEDYSGMVYCPELPKNHTLIIERNGKISLSGNSYDIGFGELSGSLERNDNILFICYDTEAYSNTGVQRSGATPFGAWTTTSQVGTKFKGKPEWKKPIVDIVAAHGIPYVAVSSIAYPRDVEMKVKKAAAMKGARFMLIQAPCTTGWRYKPELTIKVAKLAVETGLWKVFEIENGKETVNVEPNFTPIEEYTKLQGRFKHLTKDDIAFMQKKINEKWGRRG